MWEFRSSNRAFVECAECVDSKSGIDEEILIIAGEIFLRVRDLFAAAGLAVTLVACGGDSTSSGSPPPTQIPTPTPTPSPTPTPAPSYVVMDFQRSFALNSSLGYSTTGVDSPQYFFVSGEMADAQSVIRLDYSANPERVNFSYKDASISFSSIDRLSVTPYPFYQRGSDLATLAQDIEVPSRYVLAVSWKNNTDIVPIGRTGGPGHIIRTALFGTPSAPGDPIPLHIAFTGRVYVRGGIRNSEMPRQVDVGGDVTDYIWSYTSSDNSLFGSVGVMLRENGGSSNHSMRADGTFDRLTNTISGTLSDGEPDGFRGRFRGQMYGPNRAELGIVFEASRGSDGAEFFGHYIGRQ